MTTASTFLGLFLTSEAAPLSRSVLKIACVNTTQNIPLRELDNTLLPQEYALLFSYCYGSPVVFVQEIRTQILRMQSLGHETHSVRGTSPLWQSFLFLHLFFECTLHRWGVGWSAGFNFIIWQDHTCCTRMPSTKSDCLSPATLFRTWERARQLKTLLRPILSRSRLLPMAFFVVRFLWIH